MTVEEVRESGGVGGEARRDDGILGWVERSGGRVEYVDCRERRRGRMQGVV